MNPSLVKQFSYCPVIVWLKSWFLVEEPVTDSMALGKQSVQPPEGVGQLYVRSKEGSTVIDELKREKDGSLTIVEKKAYRSHNYSRYVEQAVASYIIARGAVPKVRRIRLEVREDAKIIELNEDLIKETEKIVHKTLETITKEKPPPKPKDTRRCVSCWHKRYCPYW